MDEPMSPEQALQAAGAVITHFRPRPGGRFQTRRFDECRVDHAQNYIMKGVLAPGDLAVIFGQPGCGKSLLGPLLGHAVAEGRQVFGKRTTKGRVLYVAAEAGADMEVRFVAMRERYGVVADLHLIGLPIDFQTPESPDLRDLLAEIARLQPDLVIVDTLAAAFPGLDENDAKDMGRAVRTLRSLSAPSGAAVAVIHHSPKEGNTPRGHGVLNGDADVTMRVEGQDDAVRAVHFGKNRNGSSGHAFDFRIELVELGEDQDGDVIRRPVALEVDTQESRKPKGKPLNDNQMGWLRDIHTLFATPELAEERVPLPDMCGVPTLTRDQLRVGLRGAGRFELDQSGNLTAKDRDRLREMLNALKDKGKIGLSADLVWLL